MTGRLEGKVALITGAGGGLGRAYADALASEGAAIVVNDFNTAVNGAVNSADRAGQVASWIVDRGGRAVANRDSVAMWAGAQAMVDTAIEAFGRLDIVVNNAGVNHQHRLATLTEDEVDVELDVHLKGTIAVSHFAAKYWLAQGPTRGRAIINTTSAAGLHPAGGAGIYGAAKAGVAALTVSHAQELAPLGARVNAVAPCARTRMVEGAPAINAMMPRPDEGFDRHLPEHVAPFVVYLASEANRFTGRIFAVEGPDFAIYQPSAVVGEWSHDGPWTVDEIAQELREVDQQVSVRAFVPNGPVTLPVPPGRTLRDVGAVR